MDEIFFRSFMDELNKIASVGWEAKRQALKARKVVGSAAMAARPPAASPDPTKSPHFFRKSGLESKLKTRYSPETADPMGPNIPTTPSGGLHSSLARLGIKPEPVTV